MKTAICLVVKNEAEIILEWIVFHYLIGFDAIILLDDDSTDDTLREAGKSSKLIDLRIAAWPERKKGRQFAGYDTVCRLYRKEFDWIAFLDADEFLVPFENQSVADLVTKLASADGIAVPWLMFGSSGHVRKPSGLAISNYLNRASDNFGPNRHVKSIVRPASVQAGINPHCFSVVGQYLLPNGGEVVWEKDGLLKAQPDYNHWRVHHYFVRSKEHWQDRIARGQLGNITRTIEEFHKYDLNEVHDVTATRFSQTVLDIVDRIR